MTPAGPPPARHAAAPAILALALAFAAVALVHHVWGDVGPVVRYGTAWGTAIAGTGLAGLVYALLLLLGLALDGRPAASLARRLLAPLTGRGGKAAPGARNREAEALLAPLEYAVWVLPLMGFIGTVIGIAAAVGGLETVIADAGGGLSRESLGSVLGGLRFAFDTTLLGLTAVIPVMALLALLRVREQAVAAALHPPG